MITAVVHVPAALAQDSGGRRALEFELRDGATLSDLLDEVARQFPALGRRVRDETGAVRRFVNVYVGDDESRSLDGLATLIADQQTVVVVGSVAGG